MLSAARVQIPTSPPFRVVITDLKLLPLDFSISADIRPSFSFVRAPGDTQPLRPVWHLPDNDICKELTTNNIDGLCAEAAAQLKMSLRRCGRQMRVRQLRVFQQGVYADLFREARHGPRRHKRIKHRRAVRRGPSRPRLIQSPTLHFAVSLPKTTAGCRFRL